MKQLWVILLICLNLSAAEPTKRPPSSFNALYEIDGCLEWSSLKLCQECYCDTTQAMAAAHSCMVSNGAQGYVIDRSYTNTSGAQVWGHWDIYYKYCTLDEHGNNPSSSFQSLVTTALRGIFDDQLVVSERLLDLDGNARIYVVDLLSGATFETTWNEEGGLMDFHDIDPESDEGLNHQLEEGLGFYLLDLSSD